MEVSPTNLRRAEKKEKKLNALTTIGAASVQMITENELASHLPCIVFATNEPDDVTEMPEWNSTNNIPRNVAFLVERKSLHGSRNRPPPFLGTFPFLGEGVPRAGPDAARFREGQTEPSDRSLPGPSLVRRVEAGRWWAAAAPSANCPTKRRSLSRPSWLID